ncbi:3oxoacylacylcarrier protein reductase EC 111100 [Bradyrhizobium sp.]|nr:SDR family oxidoreductase [Bradyrhizobium sp.]CUT11477.1 3oxoacylacylcarrier protein reductase EC 111100 [Bradyrhizobium sp.]
MKAIGFRISEAHFDKTFSVNVRGTLFTVQKALPLMGEGSSIVLNASITGIKGIPAFSVYAATKAAIRSFARGWSVDLRDRKIRVKVVSPGTVPTPAFDGFGMSHQQIDGFLKAQSDAAPSGRVGQPTRSPKPSRFCHATKARSSTVPSCSSMAASHRFDTDFAGTRCGRILLRKGGEVRWNRRTCISAVSTSLVSMAV